MKSIPTYFIVKILLTFYGGGTVSVLTTLLCYVKPSFVNFIVSTHRPICVLSNYY